MSSHNKADFFKLIQRKSMLTIVDVTLYYHLYPFPRVAMRVHRILKDDVFKTILGWALRPYTAYYIVNSITMKWE